MHHVHGLIQTKRKKKWATQPAVFVGKNKMLLSV